MNRRSALLLTLSTATASAIASGPAAAAILEKDNSMDNPINEAAYIPVSAPTPTMSVSPITFPVPGRKAELQLKVSAPTTGAALPVILFSHGHGPSTYLSNQNALSFKGS